MNAIWHNQLNLAKIWLKYSQNPANLSKTSFSTSTYNNLVSKFDHHRVGISRSSSKVVGIDLDDSVLGRRGWSNRLGGNILNWSDRFNWSCYVLDRCDRFDWSWRVLYRLLRSNWRGCVLNWCGWCVRVN